MKLIPYIINKKRTSYEVHFINENNEFLGHYMIKSTSHVINVYVDEKFRNQGICTKMMKYLIKNNKENINYHLEVLKENEFALKCYFKAGFKIYKESWKYYYLDLF